MEVIIRLLEIEKNGLIPQRFCRTFHGLEKLNENKGMNGKARLSSEDEKVAFMADFIHIAQPLQMLDHHPPFGKG